MNHQININQEEDLRKLKEDIYLVRLPQRYLDRVRSARDHDHE
jgi:hypothetical protein